MSLSKSKLMPSSSNWKTGVVLLVPVALALFFVALRQLSAQPPGGGPNAPDIELVADFDLNEDGFLNAEERAKARASLTERKSFRGWRSGSRPQTRGPGFRGPGGEAFRPDERESGRGGFSGRGRVPRGPAGPGRPTDGPGGQRMPVGAEGPAVAPENVQNYASEGLYDIGVLRTLFLEFDSNDWESELAAFKPTDVEVPALLRVDGKEYPQVGVSFRGASSFFSIPEGSKRSFNISMDMMDEDQRLLGYKTLNLLNCNGDATMMSSLLYSQIASQKIATPKVNFVKLVVNGRSWGIYANAQQFNKDFLKENYGSKKGARWKVSGNPNADGGLRYLGEEFAPYRERFDIKSKDEEQSWRDLINLCRLLDQTPAEDLETVLEPVLDIDGALWFLAVDVALINSDGYWTRASDYSIYQNKEGKFHMLPHDMNEAFRGSHGGPGGGHGGPGGPRGGFDPMGFLFGPPQDGFGGPGEGRSGRGGPRQRGGGYTLDPLVGLENARTPLRSKLLANPNLRERYLDYVKQIGEQLKWKHMGPFVAEARELIEAEVEADTRKLMTYEAFVAATDPDSGSLKEFCEQRSEFLLNGSRAAK